MTIARILNLLIVIFELIAFAIVRRRRSLKTGFIYYTQLSNAVAFVSSIIFVIAGGGEFAGVLRYLSVSMLAMTFFVTACILVPMSRKVKEFLFSGSGVYHHSIIPVLAVISYRCFETRVPITWIWLPVTATLIYGMVMVYLNAIGKVDGPYPFFQVKRIGVVQTIFWMIGLLIATSLLSIAVL